MKETPPAISAPSGRLLATKLLAEMKHKPGVWHDLELDEIVELLNLAPRSYPRGDMSDDLFKVFGEVCPATRGGQGVHTTYDPETRTHQVRYMEPVKVDPSKKAVA